MTSFLFFYYFFCATRGCGAGAGLGFTMLHCRLSLCADGWVKRGGIDKERGTGAVGGRRDGYLDLFTDAKGKVGEVRGYKNG